MLTREVETRRSSYLPDLTALVSALVGDAKSVNAPVLGIGVGTTGLVDYDTGRLRASLSLGLPEIPIRETLEAHFGLPVFVDNDVHAAAIGELRFGVGKRYDNFLVLNAGTGVAVGMVFNRRLHRGAANIAGEIGHTVIAPQEARCTCGLPGCLEDLMVRARNGEHTVQVPFSRTASAAPATAYYYLALALVNLVNLLNPEAVVLMGGMFDNSPEAVAWVVQAVRHEALGVATRSLLHLGLAASGRHAGLVGAAALVQEGLRRTSGTPRHA